MEEDDDDGNEELERELKQIGRAHV